MNEPSTPWLMRFNPSPRARVRLFCFPYAGGSAQLFRQWPQRLPPGVEVLAVEPPGRGRRFQERPFTRLSDLVDAAEPALSPFMDRPFAFYGHSMGALFAYEMTRRVQKKWLPANFRLIISGCRAPQLTQTHERTYDLPDPEFVEELRRLKGTPAEVLENAELLQLMLPLIRADFSVTQTYTFTEAPPLPCPLTAVGGVEDGEVKREHLEAWRELTAGAFSLYMLPGDHFFLHSSQAALLEIVSRQLTPLGDGAA